MGGERVEEPQRDGEAEPGRHAAQEAARAGDEGGHEGAQGVVGEEASDGRGREEAPQGREGVLQEHDGRVRGEGGGRGGRGVSALNDRYVDRASFQCGREWYTVLEEK